MSTVAISPPVGVYSHMPVLASGSMDRTVKLWDISNGECCKTLQGYGSGVFAVAFSPDGQTLAVSLDGTVKLWDVTTGQYRQTLQTDANLVFCVAFSPDSDSAAKPCPRPRGGAKGERASAVATLGASGQILASGSSERTIRLWDVSTGHCLKVLEGHTD